MIDFYSFRLQDRNDNGDQKLLTNKMIHLDKFPPLRGLFMLMCQYISAIHTYIYIYKNIMFIT